MLLPATGRPRRGGLIVKPQQDALVSEQLGPLQGLAFEGEDRSIAYTLVRSCPVCLARTRVAPFRAKLHTQELHAKHVLASRTLQRTRAQRILAHVPAPLQRDRA